MPAGARATRGLGRRRQGLTANTQGEVPQSGRGFGRGPERTTPASCGLAGREPAGRHLVRVSCPPAPRWCVPPTDPGGPQQSPMGCIPDALLRHSCRPASGSRRSSRCKVRRGRPLPRGRCSSGLGLYLPADNSAFPAPQVVTVGNVSRRCQVGSKVTPE